MADGAVRELAALLDAAFRGDPEHSLLAAIASATDSDWTAKLAEEGRSVRDIARHAAVAKHAYLSSAFEDGSLSWTGAEALAAKKASREEVVDFLTDGHEACVRAISVLDDAELDVPRLAHWGEALPTRQIISILIAHDFYHAGEINHLRSLIQGNDRRDYWGTQTPRPAS